METFKQLEKLNTLKEQGVLTQEEFEQEKKKILGSSASSAQRINIPQRSGSSSFFQQKKGVVWGIIGGGVFVLIGIMFFAQFSQKAQKAQALMIAQELHQKQKRDIEEKRQQAEREKEQRHQQAVQYLKNNSLALKEILDNTTMREVRQKYPKYQVTGIETLSATMLEEAEPELRATYKVHMLDKGFFFDDKYTVQAYSKTVIHPEAKNSDEYLEHSVRVITQ